MLVAGIGCASPKWTLYIANRPELDEFAQDDFRSLTQGEAADIIAATSNHWRKVFSIMAKISFALFKTDCNSWQQYRDTNLLTQAGFEAINFLPYRQDNSSFAIISGFSYAETQVDLKSLIPLEPQPKLLFSEHNKLAVTPYFDWRQLNNEKLAALISVLTNRL